MDVVAGLTAVTQGLTVAKGLRSIEKSYDEAAFKARIAEVIESLTDAKLALADAKEELAEKEREIVRLKASFEERAVLVKGEDDYKFFPDSSGQPIGYPICPRCESLNGRIVQVKRNGHYRNAQCPVCATRYEPVPSY